MIINSQEQSLSFLNEIQNDLHISAISNFSETINLMDSSYFNGRNNKQLKSSVFRVSKQLYCCNDFEWFSGIDAIIADVPAFFRVYWS